MKSATYSIALWNHEIKPDGGWCEELGAEHLGRSPRGLSILDVRRALRVLFRHWSEFTISVVRETESENVR